MIFQWSQQTKQQIAYLDEIYVKLLADLKIGRLAHEFRSDYCTKESLKISIVLRIQKKIKY